MEREENISGSTGDRVLQLVLSLLVFFLPLPVWTAACERRLCLDHPSSSRAVHDPSFPLLALSVGCGHSWGQWKRRKTEALDLQLNIWKVNCKRKSHTILHWTVCSGVSVLEVWSLLSKKKCNKYRPATRQDCPTRFWLSYNSHLANSWMSLK